jgi:hypothetical protein
MKFNEYDSIAPGRNFCKTPGMFNIVAHSQEFGWKLVGVVNDINIARQTYVVYYSSQMDYSYEYQIWYKKNKGSDWTIMYPKEIV